MVKGWNILLVIVITFLIGVILCINFYIAPTSVDGTSMSPTLVDKQQILFKKSFKESDLNRGDIIIFTSPTEEKDSYIKRIIGLPKDKVEYKSDELYINGNKVEEPYLNKNKQDLSATNTLEVLYMNDIVIEVPENEYYVLGDNRLFSKDSRNFGTIKFTDIKGVELNKNIPILNTREDIN